VDVLEVFTVLLSDSSMKFCSAMSVYPSGYLRVTTHDVFLRYIGQ